MKKKTKYTDEPMNLEVMDDFLPPPEKLVFKQAAQKVTITLSKESIDFFKYHAMKNHFPYQKMIRRVLDSYVARYHKSK